MTRTEMQEIREDIQNYNKQRDELDILISDANQAIQFAEQARIDDSESLESLKIELPTLLIKQAQYNTESHSMKFQVDTLPLEMVNDRFSYVLREIGVLQIILAVDHAEVINTLVVKLKPLQTRLKSLVKPDYDDGELLTCIKICYEFEAITEFFGKTQAQWLAWHLSHLNISPAKQKLYTSLITLPGDKYIEKTNRPV
ncbi:MAG: hypothetical protein IME94_07945 [Proteobacteria bacterium]|nr:hypothetical protein [Pseudomonadota bacterium]